MTRKPVEDIYPLSPLQQGMLFHALYAPGQGAYVEQWPLVVEGPLDVDAYVRAYQRAVDRHPALRTAFAWEGVPQPMQVVMRQAELPVTRVDWSGLADDAWQARLDALLAEGRRTGFDLKQAPLLRMTIARLAAERHLVVFAFHHTILDGWSVPLVFADVDAFYRAERAGTSVHLPPPPRYRDYIGWLRRQDAGADEAFWRRTLGGFSVPTPLPFDRGGPDVAEAHAAERLHVDAESTERLQAFARRHALTLNTLVQGAWALVLARWSGEEDVLFGTTVSGRPADLPGVERMVGVFINTVPVRVPVPGGARVGDWLAGLQARQAELRQHEHARLVDVHGWSGAPRERPLFGSLVVFENYPLGSDEGDDDGLRVTGIEQVERTNHPLTVVAVPWEGMQIRVNYDTRRFSSAHARRLGDALRTVMMGLAEDADRPLSAVPAFADGERARVVDAWNRTAVAYPRDATVHGLVAAQAAANPDAPALEFFGARVTYSELEARANRLARHLRARGVGTDDAVAVAMERSADSFVALLAILKAGAAYVPLDTAHPAARLRGMLEDCRARALVVPGRIPDALAEFAGPVVSMTGDADAIAADSADPLDVPVDADNLAYVVFTSGSTGRPKGIGVTHRAAVRLVREPSCGGVAPGGRMAQVVGPSFDVLTWEAWGPLANGGTLVGIAREEALDPAAIGRTMAERGITAAFVTSAVFAAAAREAPGGFASIDLLMVGGEAVDPAAARAVLSAGGPGRLLNGYGPAENTTYSTTHLIDHVPAGASTVPIGRPIANSTAYVVDPHLRPLPVGAPGELLVGGDGLARGYVGRAALTAERFVPDPFGAPGSRLYRTGDRARWTDEGVLEFLGRTDFQVKIRGVRIEPGEIEAALTALPGVGEAAVVARDDGGAGKRLVAYVTGRGGDAPPSAALRDALAAALPEAMVPSAFVALDALPLTPNGKVDRAALPAPEGPDASTHVPPRTPTERALAAIWREVLGVDRVGAEDGFFALGGHSLLATQVVSRVRQALDVELPIRVLFDSRTLAETAARIDALRPRGGAGDAIPHADRTKPLPLSFAQERLWFLDRLDPGSPVYNVPFGLALDGPVDEGALARALAEIVRRHEVLRTAVDAAEDAPPAARILPADAFAMATVDLASAADADEAAERAMTAEARRPFDLRAGPMIRATLFRITLVRRTLLVVIHHAATDALAGPLFTDELVALYDAFRRGAPSPLPDLAYQYADFAAWQRAWLTKDEMARQLEYWRGRLAGAPTALELPTDRPRPAVQDLRGDLHPFVLSDGAAEAVAALARQGGATRFMVLAAAFAAVLRRWTGAEDVVLGTPIVSRPRRELEPLIGFFSNTLPLRTDLSGDPSFAALLDRVRATTLEAYAHQDVPFEKLVEELKVERSLGRPPVFQVMVSHQPAAGAEARPFGDAVLRPQGATLDTSRFDLTMGFVDGGDDGVAGHVEYAVALFDAETIDRLVGQVDAMLRAAAADARRPISALPILSADDRARTVDVPNRTASPYPRGATVHGLVAEQAALRRDAPALDFFGTRTTYAELDARANRVARHLRARGVRTDDAVAVAADRGAETVVAMLAILKAGGAYVPLDVDHPAERLRYMLQACSARALVVTGDVPDALRGFGGTVVSLGGDAAEIEAESADPLDVSVDAENAAYVVFTSGSTGRPKGITIPHRAIVRLVRGAGFRAGDRVSQVSNASFDGLTWEVWGALGNGATLVGVARDEVLDTAGIGRTLAARGVTAAFLPSAVFAQAAADAPDAFAALRVLMVGGEAMDPAAARAVLDAGAPGALVNGYGPAENTTFSTTHRVTEVPAGATVPIGRPIADSTAYVLDAGMHPALPGAPGELFVGGDGLARGYAGRPALTAERFVPDPFGAPGTRLYRTGDRARWTNAGVLEFLGRTDFQVKIRGVRVEPGEVEAALTALPAVARAVVVARRDAAGTRLVAYAVPRAGVALDAIRLRDALARTLPEAMIPAAFVVMETLPLTPNGKVDRAALPVPDAAAERAHVPPRTEAERALAEIWAEVLDVDRVGAEDDFFALGGHSLLATRVVTRVRQAFGVELPLRAVFEAPTLAALASRLGGDGEGEDDELAALAAALDALPDDEVEGLMAELGGDA